jgi:beta-lactamase regulating signal transducer with metallopeptidase domain
MIDQINVIAQDWYSWMFSMFWQVSLLILIISAVDIVIKKWAWPQVRYALWILVLLKLILPPTWTFSGGIVPNIRSEIDTGLILSNLIEQTDRTITQSEEKILKQANNEKKLEDTPVLITDAKMKNETVKAALNWKAYLMGFWILGIVVFGIVLLRRIASLKKWHREQKEKKNIPEWFHEVLLKVAKTLSIERLPSIVFSNEALSPAVYGIFRPVLLLPEKYIDDLSNEEAEHVLLHELAHIKRGDLIVHGICLVLQIFYWFNPFLIWMRKQMKHVREICCDMTIANILREKTKNYKQTLVNTARELLTETMEPGMGLLGLFEEPFQLIARLRWLNKDSWKNRSQAIVVTVFVSLFLTAFLLPMGEIKHSADLSLSNPFTIEENEDYRERVLKLTHDLNEAYIDWDFEKMSELYTEDVILDQDSRPTVKGKANVLNDLRLQRAEGIYFEALESYFTDFWKDGKQLNAVEQFSYTIYLELPNLKISGSGRTFTIWEIQDDDSLKIKYSIINLDSALPHIIKGDD